MKITTTTNKYKRNYIFFLEEQNSKENIFELAYSNIHFLIN